ncbi:MAG: DUF5058 family protein [Bilifractor sp.]
MSALEIANSPVMWITCGAAVSLVVIQAILFAVRAYRAGGKVGLTKKKMNLAMKSAAITSMGPSLVILTGMLSLLITVGGPIAWMRLSMIGSVMFESMAAGIGTNVVGVVLGTDTLTNEALGMALWTMVLCSIGWIIFATFSANRMDKIQHKISRGNTKRLVAISTGAIIGVFSAMCGQHITKLDKNSLACVLGGIFMFCMIEISKKFPKIKEWNLTIAILGAMIITALIPA